MKRSLWSLASIVMIAALLLAACAAPTTQAPAPTNPPAAAPTQPPAAAPTQPPAAAPTQPPAAAPTQPPATQAPAGKAVTLTLWHGQTGAEADALATIIKNFEAANPGITVNVLAVPFDQLQNKFTTEASTGGGPDVMFGPKDWIGGYANANLIVPLDDLASQIGLDKLNPAAVDANKFKGKVYAFPESTEAIALFYNTDKVKTPPATADDLLKEAATTGLAINYGFYNAVGFIFAEGGQLFDANQKCILDQGTGTVDALKWLKTASTSTGVKVDTNGSNLDAVFKDGTVGMIFNGPWASGDYVKALGAGKVAVAPPITMPSGKTFAPFLGTKNIFLNANSTGDAKAAAIKFLAFMSLPDTQAIYAKVGHIPSNPSTPVDDPIIQGFIKQTQSATYFPNEPEMGAVWTPAGDMITKVLTAGVAPADAVKAAVETINAANKK